MRSSTHSKSISYTVLDKQGAHMACAAPPAHAKQPGGFYEGKMTCTALNPSPPPTSTCAVSIAERIALETVQGECLNPPKNAAEGSADVRDTRGVQQGAWTARSSSKCEGDMEFCWCAVSSPNAESIGNTLTIPNTRWGTLCSSQIVEMAAHCCIKMPAQTLSVEKPLNSNSTPACTNLIGDNPSGLTKQTRPVRDWETHM